MLTTILMTALNLVAAPISGDATLRSQAGPSEIVLTTTSRLAGAVHSLTWHGREFIDSTDHGRQLQSACAFDCGKSPFWAECYNPTEAGSRRDHVGPTSTSRLLSLKATPTTITTRSQMAFWLNPGELSSKRPALNAKALSDHVVAKTITLNFRSLPHAIGYDVTFTVPAGESHTLAQLEAATGYMPPGFSSFATFDPQTHQLAPLTDGPGEQVKPVVLSTPNGSHAMGIIAVAPFPKNATAPTYGRWKFVEEKVVKWNCVSRVQAAAGVPPGDYRFQMAIAVGSRENVRLTLAQLLK